VSHCSAETCLLFATAGIVLEMLRTSGPAALKDYAALVRRAVDVQGGTRRSQCVTAHVSLVSRWVPHTSGPLSTACDARRSASLGRQVLDEVHERSEQQDLVLACVREFMQERQLAHLRLVLMSATFDRQRYIEYFGVLGRGEHRLGRWSHSALPMRPLLRVP
jgi:hypothetical protein